MSAPLKDLAKLTNYGLAFNQLATALGFSAVGDINRFIFKSYGKALRETPVADRPRGAIFLLDPPAVANALAPVADLKQVLPTIQTEIAKTFYCLRLDLSGGITAVNSPTTDEKKFMAGGVWPKSHAQLLSRHSGRCVVWANGVEVLVFIGGDTYIESPDVIEELPAGLPTGFQTLSWDDGAIVFEFARHELNDTSPAGIWHLPDKLLLKPKPEKLMSAALGKFLRNRMAGYKHHDDEPYVENQGRADVSVHMFDARVFIIEVKWVGQSLSSKKEHEAEAAIKKAIKKKTKGWFTEYDQKTIISGTKQLAQYFSTGKYNKAYLAVFDCQAPSSTRKSEFLPVDQTDVAPHAGDNFRIMQACVDPRKASTVSKAKAL